VLDYATRCWKTDEPVPKVLILQPLEGDGCLIRQEFIVRRAPLKVFGEGLARLLRGGNHQE
jgi:hypothetical protein